MPTRSPRHVLAISLLMLAACVAGACGGSAPTGPSGESSFLSGTWTGTLTITRTGQPDVSGPTTWTFEVVPQTNRQQLRVNIQSTNSWLPIMAMSTVVLNPTPDPPGRIAGTGTYMSPRGCTGDFATAGDANATTITGTFSGADCDQGLGFRVGFGGGMQLTKR
jgi:hypothetical protein